MNPQIKKVLGEAARRPPDDINPERYLNELPDRRRVVLEVTLVFDQPVTDVEAIARNVLTGLEHVHKEMGLAPEDEEAVADKLMVQVVKPVIGRKRGPISI
jgi:hypothetical protein